MKKILAFVAAAVVLMGTVASCNKSGGASDVSRGTADSVSRIYGELSGNQLKMMVANDSLIDSKQLLEGLRAGFGVDTNRYFMQGLEIGLQIKKSLAGIKERFGIEVDERAFMLELVKAFESSETKDQAAIQAMGMQLDSIVRSAENVKLRKNVAAGADYVKARLAEGYTKTESGLAYKVLAEGSGNNFADGDSIEVTYVGKHIDGSVFDQGTHKFTTDGVVKGFAEALRLMKPGTKMIAVLPYDLAYGEEGQRNMMSGAWSIEPYETLVFELEAK